MIEAERAPGFSKYPQHNVGFCKVEKLIEIDFGGRNLVKTSSAIEVQETGYASRLYVPKDDVELQYLMPSDHSSYCPFKGAARYWNLQVDGTSLKNAVWAYDTPYLECRPITGYLCFYTEKPGFEVRESTSA